ncbi:MAG: hypothetical protein H0T89_32345 [Deltaproteobacteria bacterium]|nr:hypothetical protein [Deltaproteobacteria bacterium]
MSPRSSRLASVLAIGLLSRVSFAEEPTPPPAEPAPPPAETPAAPPADPPPDDRPAARIAPPRREIVIEVPGERSRTNMLLCGGLAGAGVLVGLAGLYWHLDSRDAADEVSTDRFSGRAWTPAHQDLVERADRSKTLATGAYIAGGAFVIGAALTFIFTAPKTTTEVIKTGTTVTPVRDGAMVTRMWSF